MLITLITLILATAFTGCSASRKYQADLRGLMLQDNLQMKRNKAYFSRHNAKIRKQAFRQSRRGGRMFGS